MMRAVVFAAGFLLAAAGGLNEKEKASCALDGGRAANDLTDASLFAWAADKRCGKVGNQVKCAIDIASAIESINGMVNVIVKAVDNCGDIKTADPECGRAAGELTENMAGIAAASGGVADKCPTALNHVSTYGVQPFNVDQEHLASPHCVIDLKDSANGLLNVVQELSKVKKTCAKGKSGSEACVSNALAIVASFAKLGEHVMGTIGHCTSTGPLEGCGSDMAALIAHLTGVGEAGLKMSKACKKKGDGVGGSVGVGGKPQVEVVTVEVPVQVAVPTKGRLYEEVGMNNDHTASTGSLNFALVAFLPVLAVVSFVGGRFYGSRRSSDQQGRELLSLEEPDEAAE